MAKKKPIVSKYGQWKYPGQETIIPDANGRITMQGVPYPVFGIDDLGNQQLMMPGMEYQFPGNSVYEIPMMKNGGTKKVKIHSLPKAQKGAEIIRFQKSLRNPASYQDSIDVANASQKAMDWYIANGYYNLNAPVFIGPKDPQMPIFPENPAEWKAKPNTGPARATHIHLGGHTEFGKDDLGKSGVEWDLPEVEVTIPAGVNQVVQDGFSGLGNLVGEGIAGAANLVKGDELAQWLNDYQFLQYGDEHKRILNKDAPRILYDSRIQPRTNLGLQGTAPGYFSGNADIVDLPLYEKWYTTPWSLLSDADKRKRLEFGILDGTPFKDWNDVRLINSYPDLAMAQGGRRQYDEQTIKNAAASGYAPTQEGAAQYEKNKWAKNPKVYDAQTIANAAKYGYPATQSGAAEYELNNWQRKPSSGSTKPKKEPNANTDIGYYMRTELGLDRKQTSYEERKKLAERYGIENYSGTSKQNMELLNRIKSESDPRESVLNMLSGKNTSTVPNTETSINASSSKTETDSKSTVVEQPESVKKNVRQHREGIYVTPIHTANNGVVYRVHDKNQKFIAWEDELGNIIPVQNATGSPTSDFDPIYKPKQQTENFAYGGEPDFDKPKVNFSSKTKSSDKDYLYKQTLYADGSTENKNRRTLKGFITGAPKPGEPGGPPKLQNGGDISIPDLRRFTVNNLRKAQGGGEGEPQYETVTVNDPTDPRYLEYSYLQNLYNWSNLPDYDQRDSYTWQPGYFYGNVTEDYKREPADYSKEYKGDTGKYDDGSTGVFVDLYDPKEGTTNYTSDELGYYDSKANKFNFATKAELDKWIRKNQALRPGIYGRHNADEFHAPRVAYWNEIMTKYQPIGYDAMIDWNSPRYGYHFSGDYNTGKKRWIYKKPDTPVLEDTIDRAALRKIYPQLTDADIDEYVADERLNPSYITNLLDPDKFNFYLNDIPRNTDVNKEHPLVLKQSAYTDPDDIANKHLTPAGTTGYLPEDITDWNQTQRARYLPRFGTPESYLGKRYVYEEPVKEQPESPKEDPVGHKANVYRTPIHTANNGVVYRVHDDQQKFIAWEDEAGNVIPVENATGSPTTDFDPVYKPKIIKAPKFNYGGPLPKAQKGKEWLSLGYEDKVYTYKDNPEFFDSHARLHDNPKYNEQLKKMVYAGKWGYNPVTGVAEKLNPDQQKAADPITQNLSKDKRTFNEIRKTDKAFDEYLTEAEKKSGKAVASAQSKAMVSNPAFYAPGIIGAAAIAPEVLPAVFEGIGGALATPFMNPFTGAAIAPGLTAGNLLNAGFAAHGLKTIASGEVIEPWRHAADTGNPIDYLSAAGQNLMTGLEILPIAAPIVKGGLELARPAVNAAGYRLPGMSLPMPEMPAIGPQAEATPWIAESLPGLHLESTITGGPISKIVEPKTGMVNVEQALKIIGKESGGNEKLELVRSALGENIPAKMDYNQFRKLVQDAIIPLERRTVNYRSNYGLGHIGYPSPSKKNIQLALDNSNQEVAKLTEDLGKIESQIADIKGFRESIANDPSKSYMANATDEQLKAYLEGLRSNVETSLITSKKLVESNSKMLAEAPLENETLLLSNKTKLGRGSDAHDNPVETLGHIHYMVDAENPKTLVMTQMQSDAFQSAHNTMHKSRKAAAESLAKTDEYHNKMVELLEDAELIPGGGYRLKDGTEMTAEVYRELTGSGRQTIKDMLQAEVDNFGQKLLLNKKHQERYLQEFVDMAAGKGMDKVRVPTSGTSAKIQGYNPLEFNPNLPEAVDARNKIMEANRLYGPESEQFKTATAEYDAMVNNTKPDYIPSHKTILKKYDEMPKLIKKTFGEEVQIVTDSKGNTWYEFSIPQNFREGKGEIKAFRKGGPLLRAQKGLPVDYQSFLNYSETAPENRRPDTEWQYGNPRQYDHYGMWDALGKPKNFEEALQKNPHWQPDPYDGMYHGFSTNPDTGVWLKSHIPGESHPGDTGWMEYKDFMLSNDANWGGKNQNLVFDPELQRMRYVERKKQGGSMKRVKINALPNNWKTK
jgi:hypothetical protein